MKQQAIRKNNDKRFAWYIEQSDVEYAQKMFEEGRLVQLYGCLIPEKATHTVVLDSDGFIMGIKCISHRPVRILSQKLLERTI